jgi:hypothetical protein
MLLLRNILHDILNSNTLYCTNEQQAERKCGPNIPSYAAEVLFILQISKSSKKKPTLLIINVARKTSVLILDIKKVSISVDVVTAWALKTTN